ncbi:MAG: porin family protein [Bacteroidota bacterium]
MATSYFWHQFYLHGRKISIAFLLYITTLSTLSAQSRGMINLPDYDDRLLHYGFLMALNFTDYRIQTTDFYAAQSDVVINPKTSAGFSVGLVATLNISNHFDLRFSPTASFNERLIEFKQVSTGEAEDRLIESTIIDLPLMLKFKSQRRKNSRVYLVAGLKPSLALATRQAEEENLIRADGFDIALEYGLGLEHFFPMFKFAPEVRFSHGLMNVFINDENDFSGQINGLYNHSISIFLFFE